jgi:hypothetical protein
MVKENMIKSRHSSPRGFRIDFMDNRIRIQGLITGSKLTIEA